MCKPGKGPAKRKKLEAYAPGGGSVRSNLLDGDGSRFSERILRLWNYRDVTVYGVPQRFDRLCKSNHSTPAVLPGKTRASG
jgi:hypothetical protein